MEQPAEPREDEGFERVEIVEVALVHCGVRSLVYSVRLIGATRVRYWKCPTCGATTRTTEYLSAPVPPVERQVDEPHDRQK